MNCNTYLYHHAIWIQGFLPHLPGDGNRRSDYPDLPFKDYMEEYRSIAEEQNVRIIMLITPETSEERIRLIDEHTDGFIYMVSSAAITGAQKDFNAQKQAYFQRIADMNLRNPRMIGSEFPISKPSKPHPLMPQEPSSAVNS